MKQYFTVAFFLLAGLGLLPGLGAATAQAQAPTVVSRQPARHAPAAPRSGPVTVQFSQAITAASATRLRVYGSQGRGLKSGTLSGGGTTTLSLAPTQPFAPGERISVSVPSTLTNAAGTGVAKQVYEFTAAAGGTGKGFFLDTTATVSAGSRDQLLGDIDGDGDLDLLTASGLFGMFSYLNDGQGHFTPYFNTVVGQTPSGATLADMNQDGYLDLLAGDADNATVAVAMNNGTGVFGLPPLAGQYVNVGARPVSVTTGDVDGDGDLDFASANNTASTVTIGFNGGASAIIPYSITSVTTVSVGQQPTTVQLADVDNDGDLDLLTSNATGNSVSVRLNTGAGTFAAATTVAVGGAPSDLGLADLDADGDLDLITTNATDGTVSVRLNSGTGTFGGTTTVALPPGSAPTALRIGDVDADGDLDVVVAQGAGGQVFTLLNMGGSLAVQYGPLELRAVFGSALSLGVTLGDVDGDGDLDLLTADQQRSLVLLGRNGGAPPVGAPALTAILPGAGPVGATGIRLTGDNLSSTSAVFFNGISASFVVNSNLQVTATVPAGATTGPVSVTTAGGAATSAQSFIVTAGPVPAVLVAGTAPARHTYGGSPTAAVQVTFSSPIDNLSVGALRVFGSQRRGRQLGAVSGGGTPTLSLTPSPAFAPGERVALSLPASLTSTAGGSVQPQVIEFRVAAGGTGQGDYGPVVSSAALGGISTYGLRSLDVDNDGDLDFVGAVGNPATLVVRINNGAGTFAAATGLPAFAGPVGEPVPADVDGDGDLDLLVPESLPSPSTTVRLRVLLNNGSGQFGAGITLATPYLAGLVRVGDLDADGDLDLAYVEGTTSLRVALNNGTGIFTLLPTSLYLNFPTQLRLGDVDNDGDLDAVAVTGSSLLTALNNGQGQFALLPSVSLGNIFGANLELGDFNRDGRLDVVTTTTPYGLVSTPLLFWAGLGTGQYALGVAQAALPADLKGLSLADVNADGNLDVVGFSGSGGNGIPTIGVRLGNGNGQFQLPTDVAVSTAGTTLYGGDLADFDGDGDLDLLYLAGTTAELRLNEGRPAPTLTTLSPASGPVGTRVLLTGTSLRSAQRVTFNGVPALSVTVLSDTQCATVVPAGATTGPVVVTTPGGSATSPGSFIITTPLPIASQSPARNAVSVPRLANVTVGFGQATAAGNLVVRGSLLQGQRAGTATGAGTSTRGFDPALDFAPGEQVQVSVPAPAGSGVQPQVFDFTAAAGGPGQGNMRWSSFIASSSYSSVYGDFDEDGAVDIIVRETTGNRLRVLFNDGQGKFGARSQVIPSTTIVRAMRLADLNGDSHLDLVLGEYYAYRITHEVDRLVWRAGTGTGSFGPVQPLHVINGAALDIQVGDLNGDGTADLTALTETADSVMVSLNLGNGVFQRRADVAATRAATTLRLADIDNDGNLDLLTAGGTAQIGRNLGTGTGDFVPAAVLPYTEQVLTFELGDIDNDGNLDLFAGTATSYYLGNVRLRRGTGQGDFGAVQNVGGNGYFSVLRLADFDADGDLDLAATQGNIYTGPQLLLNSGTGTFTAGRTLAPSTATREMNVADFNLDGSLDIVANGDSLTNTRPGLFTYLNRPAPPAIAGFTPTTGGAGTVVTLTGTNLAGITSVTVGGILVPFTVVSNTQLTFTIGVTTLPGPIVLTSPNGNVTSASPFAVIVPLSVITSFTPGSGAVQRLVVVTGTDFRNASAVRFNGVLAPGFAVNSNLQLSVLVPGGATTGPLSITTPGGTGTSATPFVVAGVATGLTPTRNAQNVSRTANLTMTFAQSIGSAAADVRVFGNRLRGQRAVALAGSGTPTLTLDPTQDFAPGEELSVTIPNSLQGTLAGVGSKQVYQFRAATGGAGRGTFGGGQNLTTPFGIGAALQLADLDNDGDLDLVSASVYDRLLFSLNNGSGTFTYSSTVLMPGNVEDIKVGDVDGDGDLDVLSSQPYGGTVSILINNGAGTFTTGQNTSGFTPGDLAVGDVDGDGDLDLLNVRGGVVAVLLNNGSGTFSTGSITAVDAAQREIQLGDLDNDGDLDFIASGPNNNGIVQLVVRLNNGNGAFSGTYSLPLVGDFEKLALGDMDGDGDLDVVVGDYNPATTVSGLTVLLNNGAASFTAKPRLPRTGALFFTDALVLGDIDADGDLDALLSGSAITSVNQEAYVYLNDSQANLVSVTPAAVDSQPQGLALGDLDGDGDLDLAAATGYANTISIRLNGVTTPTAATTAATAARLQLYPNPAHHQVAIDIPAGVLPQAGTPHAAQ